MEANLEGSVVRAGPAAREQFYDARGYGRPDDGGVVLAPVEAAHLLFRGDLTAVDGMDFRSFLATEVVSAVDFLVYRDLRERGFYLSPATGDRTSEGADAADFVVYPRGAGPWDDEIAYRVRVASERAGLPADDLTALGRPGATGAGVLAVVDEESEVTFFEVSGVRPAGESEHDLPGGVSARLLSDRVLVPEPPAALYESAFYGQRLGDADRGLHLSLVEAAHLANTGTITLPGGAKAISERGRTVEGERFTRRLRVYTRLREAGIVPKTGYKFGADFRTYESVTDVAELGHSEWLVRVLASGHVFQPRDLALDVRMANGVRKRMIYGLVGERDVDWLAVGRLRP